MSHSKEAWHHFVFVPCSPPRRLARARDHGAFLGVNESSASPPVVHHRCQWHGDRTCVTRNVGLHMERRAPHQHTRDEQTAVQLAEAASLLLGVRGLGAGNAQLAMVPPVPPPVTAPRTSSTEASDHRFLNMLFPSFDTDMFIWRISVLQMIEYLASLLLGGIHGAPKVCSLYLLGASWGPAIAAGAIWRLMFPMMLHANPLHLFFNLFFQLRIGFGMEKQFGRKKFCLLYLFCAFFGNLLSVVYDPIKLTVGASTSGFGLLGVWLAEVFLTWGLLGDNRSRIFLWMAFMVLTCVMMSTISPNVDFMGHLGGALGGLLLALILADMRQEHQPQYYGRAKQFAKPITLFIIAVGLAKVVVFGPDGPVPHCGRMFAPRVLPF